jgi:hypothetical protein
MANSPQHFTIPHPGSQGLTYSAATYLWVNTGGEYAYNTQENTQSVGHASLSQGIQDTDIKSGWAPEELGYITQESLAHQLSFRDSSPPIYDSSMRDGWDISTDAASTMHTVTMRVASRMNDPGETHSDRNTVRDFLGDQDGDIHMDEDEDEDDASSALTSLPSRYNSPRRTAARPLFDDASSIKSQDEGADESAVDDLILACAEQEVEDDDVKSDEESDDGASHTGSDLASYPALHSDHPEETSGRGSPSPFPSPRRSGRRGKAASRRRGLRSSPRLLEDSSTE